MNLQDRIVDVLERHFGNSYDSHRLLAAKAILALVEPTVSEQCCSLCVRSDYTGSDETTCAHPNCPCHSPSSGVEPTAPVGWESEFRERFVEDGDVMHARWSDETKEIIDFIRQTIKNREREIAEGVEKKPTPQNQLYATKMWNLGYNAAIDSFIALINKQ